MSARVGYHPADVSHDWLEISRGSAPLIVSFPHTGTDLPAGLGDRFVSPWLARRDADWWIHLLYGFVRDLGATTIRTSVSRTVIDVNRSPDGASLYPGQNTTGLCPTITFDNEPLYLPGLQPTQEEIEHRRLTWFDPYHQALATEIARLRKVHPNVVVYDAHSIRSRIPHLFDGELPQFNIGTASRPDEPDRSCAPTLGQAVKAICADSGLSYTTNGRFRGGWITRHYGRPSTGVHCIQMELACRGYMDEPATPSPHNWPSPMRPSDSTVLPTLRLVMSACLRFAEGA